MYLKVVKSTMCVHPFAPLKHRHTEGAFSADNLDNGDYVPESQVIPKGKEKSMNQANVWRSILTVTEEVSEEVFEHGIHTFENKVKRNATVKAKRDARWDQEEVSTHVARCCLWKYIMHPTRAPSVLDGRTKAGLLKLWRSGTAAYVLSNL